MSLRPIIGVLGILCFHLQSSLALWPAPRSSVQGQELIRLTADFKIDFHHDLSESIVSDLQQAVLEAQKHIESDQHQILTEDRGRSLYFELTTASDQLKLSRLEIKLSTKILLKLWRSVDVIYEKLGLSAIFNKQSSNDTVSSDSKTTKISVQMQLPIRNRDESYRLRIKREAGSKSCVGVLEAPSALGIIRGLSTFTQLIYTALPPESSSSITESQTILSERPETRFIYGPLDIKDAPAFAYRGVLLDTSRHFYPIEDLYRTIDAMSWAKLNVLHWHIVDSQSWPFEIPTHARLAQKGAYSDSEIYSPEQIKQLAAYAQSRGVEIMLEIDTPGHTAIIGESYPDLVACKDAQPWNLYAAEPPAGQLRIADHGALTLAKEIFKYAANLIPGTLFSSGGDEVNMKCYEDDEPTQSALELKNQTLNEVLSDFVLETHQVIRKSGKTPVVWEELILEQKLDLPRDTIVAVWRTSANVKQVIDSGYSIIHAASDFSYLDCGQGGWLGNSSEGNSWCDPYKTWQKIYSFDPYANVTTDQRQLILGGQALLWSEQTDSQNLDSMIWPRALSTAEVYWTGVDRPNRLIEALPRMQDMRYRMIQRGIRATPLQPHWCAVRVGQCDLPY